MLNSVERRRLVHAQWIGVGGVALLGAASAGVGALPADVTAAQTPVLRWFVRYPTLALACALVGMGLLVLAWLGLGAFVRPGRARLASTGQMYRTLVMWGAPLLVVPPLFSRDVYSYLAQGVIAARGLSPYQLGPAQALGVHAVVTRDVGSYWRDTPTPYGPVFVTIERAIAALTGHDVVAAVLLHRLVELVGIALIVWALPRLARKTGVPEPSALWLGALNPLVLWHLFAGAHNDALMLGLMLAGVEIALGGLRGVAGGEGGRPQSVDGRVEIRRFLIGTVMITLAANVKITAVVALACVGVALAREMGGRIRHLVVAAIGMVVVFVAVSTAVSAGSGLGFGWVHTLATPDHVDSWMAPTNEIGFLVGGIGSLLGAHITQSAIRVAELVGAVVAVILGVRLILAAFLARVHPLRALGLLMALVLVCGPTVQPWYLLWVVVPLAAVVHVGRSRTVLVAVVAVVAVILPPTGGSFAGHVTGLVEAYAAALLVLGIGLVVARWKLYDAAGHTAHPTPSPADRREPF